MTPHARRPQLSLERSAEEQVDRLLRVLLQRPGAGPGDVRMRDQRGVGGAALAPVFAGPREPGVLLLIEDVQRLVAQLRELRAPSGATSHGPVVENRADDVDLLAAVHLIPERLEDRKSTRLNSSHVESSYAVFCLKKKKV